MAVCWTELNIYATCYKTWCKCTGKLNLLFLHDRRPLSEPLDLVEGRGPLTDPLRGATLAPVAQLGSLSPGFPRRGVCESGDLLAPKLSRQDCAFGDFGSTSPSPSLSLSLRSAAPDPPPAVKSLGALQQICEEEEEEEEEDGVAQLALRPCKPSLIASESSHEHCSESKVQSGLGQLEVRGRSGTLAELEEEEEDCSKWQSQVATKVTEELREESTSKQPREDKDNESQTENNHKQPGQQGWENASDQLKKVSEKQVTEGQKDQDFQKLDVPTPRLGVVQCCLGQREPSKDILEDNNNTPSKPKMLDQGVISATCSSPRSLPKNHCVDLGPDGVEMRKTGGEGEKTEETQTKPQQGQRVSRDVNTDIKNKNVNLRDRLLQFPLCEKALSFNIQPTSKEKLLPFAQYNCCHVL